MLRRLFNFTASLALWAASSLFIAGLLAVAISSFLLTWPLVWGSPIKRRVPAGVNLLSALLQFLSTMPSRRMANDMVDMAQQAMHTVQEDENNGSAPYMDSE